MTAVEFPLVVFKKGGDVDAIPNPGLDGVITLHARHKTVPRVGVIVQIATSEAVGVPQPKAVEVRAGCPRKDIRGRGEIVKNGRRSFLPKDVDPGGDRS